MAGEGDRGRGGRRRRAGVVDRREYDRDDEADEGGGDGDGDGSGHAVGVVCVMLFDDGQHPTTPRFQVDVGSTDSSEVCSSRRGWLGQTDQD